MWWTAAKKINKCHLMKYTCWNRWRNFDSHYSSVPSCFEEQLFFFFNTWSSTSKNLHTIDSVIFRECTSSSRPSFFSPLVLCSHASFLTSPVNPNSNYCKLTLHSGTFSGRDIQRERERERCVKNTWKRWTEREREKLEEMKHNREKKGSTQRVQRRQIKWIRT